jgi:hypothetical protein
MRKLVNPSRRTAVAAVAVAAALGAGTAFVSSASASAGHSTPKTRACGLSTLNGHYLFQGNGTALNNPNFNGPVPIAYAGSFDFDGAGHITGGHITSNLNGIAVSNIPFTGTYTVAADCSGTFAIGDATYNDLYASHSGDQFTYIQTREGSQGDHDLDVTATTAHRVH